MMGAAGSEQTDGRMAHDHWLITRSTQSESAGCGEVGATVTFVPVGGATKTKQNNRWNKTEQREQNLSRHA